MAIDYDLYLEATLDSHKIGTFFEKPWVAPSVIIRCRAPLPMAVDMIEEAFHFTPIVRLAFTVAKNDPVYSVGLGSMMKCVDKCLAEFDGRAVLSFNGEIVVLQRADDGLVLNREIFHSQNFNRLIPILTHRYALEDLKQPLL